MGLVKEMVIGEVDAPNLIDVSFSELSCFRRCQMKHHYRYIKNIEKKTKALPLERGSALHRCLEALYTTGEWKPEWKKFRRGEGSTR
jgi:ATP-dependent helicase/DNAse subunit B